MFFSTNKNNKKYIKYLLDTHGVQFTLCPGSGFLMQQLKSKVFHPEAHLNVGRGKRPGEYICACVCLAPRFIFFKEEDWLPPHRFYSMGKGKVAAKTGPGKLAPPAKVERRF